MWELLPGIPAHAALAFSSIIVRLCVSNIRVACEPCLGPASALALGLCLLGLVVGTQRPERLEVPCDTWGGTLTTSGESAEQQGRRQ